MKVSSINVLDNINYNGFDRCCLSDYEKL